MSATETTQDQHTEPPATRESILLALEAAGWEIDSDEAHVIEASDGERYGVAVFFERGVPVEICYGDGDEDLQFCEEWHEAPGLLAPEEVARLFGDEERRAGMTEQKVHHQTERGARIALAKEQISQESYDAVLAGSLTLAEAKKRERERPPDAPTSRSGSGAATESAREGRERPQEDEGVPPQPTSRISKDDTTQECWCGCSQRTSPGRRFRPGHDKRAEGIIKRAMAASKVDELSDGLRDYGQERGLI